MGKRPLLYGSLSGARELRVRTGLAPVLSLLTANLAEAVAVAQAAQQDILLTFGGIPSADEGLEFEGDIVYYGAPRRGVDVTQRYRRAKDDYAVLDYIPGPPEGEVVLPFIELMVSGHDDVGLPSLERLVRDYRDSHESVDIARPYGCSLLPVHCYATLDGGALLVQFTAPLTEAQRGLRGPVVRAPVWRERADLSELRALAAESIEQAFPVNVLAADPGDLRVGEFLADFFCETFGHTVTLYNHSIR